VTCACLISIQFDPVRSPKTHKQSLESRVALSIIGISAENPRFSMGERREIKCGFHKTANDQPNTREQESRAKLRWDPK
jgi:hypothetical protein